MSKRNSYVKIETIKQGSRVDQAELTYVELSLMTWALMKAQRVLLDEDEEKAKLNRVIEKLLDLTDK